MEIINFIKNNSDWKEKLSNPPYCLIIKEKDNLIMFKYNQAKSDFNEKICREARGLILEKDTWIPVRVAFYKFFNIEEKFADQIDWDSAIGFEKIDGSLLSLYYYNDKWNLATNGGIDAYESDLPNPIKHKTFGQLFDDVIEQYKIDFESLNKNYCYTFEVVSLENKVVISYSKDELYHLLTRDMRTLEEIEVDIGIPKPNKYIFSNKEDYQMLVSQMSEDHEGIVVKDKNCNRVKIKTPLYFELHKQINNGKVTVESALSLILDNDQEEFLSYFKEQRPFFKKVETAYIERSSKIIDVLVEVAEWRHNNMFATRKDFATWVKKKDRDFNYYFLAYDDKLEAKMVEIGNDVKKIVKFLKLEDI